MTGPDVRLIYIGDPMCSWCWGFAPEIEKVAQRFDAELDVIMGGLRPGPDAQPLDDRMIGFLRAEWTKISEVTGQPFSFATLDRKGWLYDTEVPAAAVALGREIGLSDLLGFMARVQHAFYAEAVDVTRPESYEPLWTYEKETEATAAEFVQRLQSPESRELAYADFARARQLGIRGFPALVFEREGNPPLRKMVSYGYQPFDHLAPVLEHLLESDPT